MKKLTLSTVALLSIAGSFGTTLSASDDFTLFSNAKFNGEVKARYEGVDDESNAVQQANAYTVRAMLGLETTLLGIDGLTMKVDGTTVQTLGGTKYNDLSPTKFTNYDVVADPEQTRFTQGYLQYKLGATTVKAGRQLTNLDTQRFIGSVDWRQMPQSLDAVSISNTSIPALSLYGAYVYSYATVFDEASYGQSLESKSLILNAGYKVNSMLKVTAYDYMLSLEKNQFAADTYGLSLDGDIPAGPAKIAYRAEYAKQGDSTFDKTASNVKGENDAYYYNLEALANISGLLAGVGYEFLSGTTGSDGKTKFETPLATLHKFNGWADKFLATPTGGLVDTSMTLGYTAPGLGKAMAIYHDFETDVAMGGKSDLGSELDFLYTNAVPGVKGLNGLIKAAFYDGGDVNTGTTSNYSKDKSVVWLELDYKF